MSSNSNPEIPPRASSKRPLTRSEEEEAEEKQKAMIKAHKNVEKVGKKIRLSTSFNAHYWNSAVDVLNAKFIAAQSETHYAMALQPRENRLSWWQTEEAAMILARMRAVTSEKDLYKQQEKRIEQAGPIRRCFMALFNTSYIGINADKAGEGKRERSEQSNFKKSLIKAYDAGKPKPGKKKGLDMIFDVATGEFQDKALMIAAHIVPHSLGTDIMATLFGKEAEAEMNSPLNGILLQTRVEKALDLGIIVIVPDVAEDAKEEEWVKWESSHPREYKWKIVDHNAKLLEENCLASTNDPKSFMKISELDGKRLHFRPTSDHRPRARYLYFLHVAAILKKAWDHDNRRKPEAVLKEQIGKRMWATKGRYLHRAMLVAMSQEAGHHLDEEWDRPPRPGSDDDELQPDAEGALGLIAIAKYIATSQETRAEEEEEDSSDDETQEDEMEGKNGEESTSY